MRLLAVATAGLSAALASLVGTYLVWLWPRASQKASLRLVALAGGVVLGAVFLHLLPEAVSLAPGYAWPATLGAFLVLYLVESHTLPHVHGPHSGDAGPPHVRLGHLAMLGFGAHALFDGLALGAGWRQGEGLAETALVAVFAHKVPEGMALISLLHEERGERALRRAWGIALMTPCSAVATYALLGEWLKPLHMGLVLSFVAGSFLYIAASDLLPEVRRSPRADESGLILAGIAVVALLDYLL